jgi:glycosyltransferase involved in cell wall biosynthesis
MRLYLAALYFSMDVIFNSLSEETFGLTSVEAMAFGIPAVLYVVSASRDIQPDFMRRGIVERHHYGDTAKIIGQIATSVTPKLTDSLVRYVSQKFSPDAFLSAYYGLYSRIGSVPQVHS